MLMRRLVGIFALASLLACSTVTLQELQSARFFVNGNRDKNLLKKIRESTDSEVNFSGHYSMAFVSCGTFCFRYWFVDRRNGGVIEAPASSFEHEMTWDVIAKPDSDIINVIFGPDEAKPTGCSVQQYRLSSTTFQEFGPRSPAQCPS